MTWWQLIVIGIIIGQLSQLLTQLLVLTDDGIDWRPGQWWPNGELSPLTVTQLVVLLLLDRQYYCVDGNDPDRPIIGDQWPSGQAQWPSYYWWRTDIVLVDNYWPMTRTQLLIIDDNDPAISYYWTDGLTVDWYWLAGGNCWFIVIYCGGRTQLLTRIVDYWLTVLLLLRPVIVDPAQYCVNDYWLLCVLMVIIGPRPMTVMTVTQQWPNGENWLAGQKANPDELWPMTTLTQVCVDEDEDWPDPAESRPRPARLTPAPVDRRTDPGQTDSDPGNGPIVRRTKARAMIDPMIIVDRPRQPMTDRRAQEGPAQTPDPSPDGPSWLTQTNWTSPVDSSSEPRRTVAVRQLTTGPSPVLTQGQPVLDQLWTMTRRLTMSQYWWTHWPRLTQWPSRTDIVVDSGQPDYYWTGQPSNWYWYWTQWYYYWPRPSWRTVLVIVDVNCVVLIVILVIVLLIEPRRWLTDNDPIGPRQYWEPWRTDPIVWILIVNYWLLNIIDGQ